MSRLWFLVEKLLWSCKSSSFNKLCRTPRSLSIGIFDFAESGIILRSSPPRTLVLTSRQVVIRTSGAFKSLWSEQDGDLTFLHKIQLFF